MIDVLEYADLLHGPFPGGLPGHNEAMEVYRTNIEKAKEHLALSAYPEGGITLRMVHVAGYEQQRRIGLIFLDALAQLGITLEIEALNWPDMVAEAGSPETQADFMAVWESANYADLDNFAFPAFHSSQNGNWSNPVYNDPKVDEMIVTAREETDPAVRAQIYQDMQAYLVDQASDIYAATLQRLIAHRDTVTGYSYTPIGTNAPEFFPLSVG
jgi:peptide/nickel transport system substrate-binding protein